MSKVSDCDVVVIGAGISGLSTVLHLNQQNVHNIILVDAPERSTSSLCPGGLSGSFLDNYSRITVVHGLDQAYQIVRFAQNGFLSLLDYLNSRGLPVKVGPRIRLLNTAQEVEEAQIACSELNKSGFSARFLGRGDESEYWSNLGSSILGMQLEGQVGGWTDPTLLLDSLRDGIDYSPICDRVVGLEYLPNRVQLNLENGTTIRSEMVCLCSHIGIDRLIPELKGVFVPYADQWEMFSFEGNLRHLEGSYLSIGHGYQYGGVPISGSFVLGGGRFLRKGAGIGKTASQSDERVSDFLFDQVRTHFMGISNVKRTDSRALVGCRPCDELPVIGPMFGDGRVLVASGFMGTGLGLGFLAGKCLADFVSFGKSDLACEKFLPIRLRSMRSE